MSVAEPLTRALWGCLDFYRKNRGVGVAARILQYLAIWRSLHTTTVNISEEGWESLKNLADSLGISANGKEEQEAFLFILESYLATLMKLILLERRGAKVLNISQLQTAFSQVRGIIEEDLFEWFADAYSDGALAADLRSELDVSFRLLSESLWEVELGKIDFDLFREIYQNIVSPEIRRSLGEFYTNEEIVNEVLDSCSLKDDEIQRMYWDCERKGGEVSCVVLDPACGSGTFLITAIERIIRALNAAGIDEPKICNFIAENVVGIDINPFAAYMAKLNILLKLAQVLPTCQPPSLKIIWGDSLVRHEETTTPTSGLPLTIAEIPFLAKFMPVGQIQLPHPRNFLPAEHLIDLLEDSVKRRMGVRAVLDELGRRGGTVANNLGGYAYTLEKLYAMVEKMYASGNSRLVRLLKNVIKVTGLRGKCRYVIGNPPWVRVHGIDETIRGYLREKYEVFQPNGAYRPNFQMTRVPFVVQFDYSMAFVEAGLQYLADGGNLGYVITSKVAQTTYAGGLRQMLLTETTILKLVDYSLYKLALFRDAVNYPLILAVTKQKPPEGHRVLIKIHNTLGDSKEFEELQNEFPLYAGNFRSPWILAPPRALESFRKMQRSGIRFGDLYEIMRGVVTAANDLYLVPSVRSVRGNLAEVDLEGGSVARVEKNMLAPLLRGEDIDPFTFGIEGLIIFTHGSKGDIICRKDQEELMGLVASKIRELLPKNQEAKASASGTTLIYEAKVDVEKLEENLRLAFQALRFSIRDVSPCAVSCCWEITKHRQKTKLSIERLARSACKIYIEGLEIPGRPYATAHFLNNMAKLVQRDDYRAGQLPWVIFRVSQEKLKDKLSWQENATQIEATLLPSSIQCEVNNEAFSGPLVLLQTAYFIVPNNVREALSLLSYLNSPLARAFMKLVAWKARGGFFRHISASMGHLPIPEKWEALYQLIAGHAKDSWTKESLDKMLEATKDICENVGDDLLNALGELMGLSVEEAMELIQHSEWLNPVVEEGPPNEEEESEEGSA